MAWAAYDSALGMPDPAAVEGSHTEKMVAFNDAMRMLTNQIGIFISLPVESINRLSLQKKLDEIGSTKNIELPEPHNNSEYLKQFLNLLEYNDWVQ